MEEKKHQPRILYPIKLSFKNEKEIKTIPEKPKVRKFVASTLALQKKCYKNFFRETEYYRSEIHTYKSKEE